MKTALQWQCRASVVLVGLAIVLAACGGGGGSAPRPPSPPPPPALAITTSQLAPGIVGTPYSQALEATGGTPPYSWSLASTSRPLPTGLTLSSDGLLSGTPTDNFETIFTFQVRDAAAKVALRTLSMILVRPLILFDFPFPAGNVGVPFPNHQLGLGGGSQSPHTWTVTAGALPDGLSFTPAGIGLGVIVFSGTPTREGTFSFTLQVDDPGPPAQSTSHAYSIAIANNVVVLTFALPATLVDRPVSQTLQAVGGTPPYTWAFTVGDPPPGISLDPATGQLSGTPAQAGFYVLRVSATDSSNPPKVGQQAVTWDIRPSVQILTTALNDCAVGTNYFQFVSVSGGVEPLGWRVSAGSLPPGLSLPDFPGSFGGWFGGQCTQLGTYGFTLELSDSSSPPSVDSQDLQIRAVPRLLLDASVFPPSPEGGQQFPDGLEGQAYDFTFAATGGVQPYTWTLAAIPAGLSLDPATGHLSGTPSEFFDQFIFFQVSDQTSPAQEVSAVLRLHIIGRLNILTTRLPRVRQGAPFEATLDFKGGIAPFIWSIASGSLPPGLALDSTPRLIGTPNASGTFNFTLRVADSGTSFPQSDLQSFSMIVAASPGRNDTIATASPLSNGTFTASVAPFADPADTANPDNDYYAVVASGGSVVTIETIAERLASPSPLDTVIELVDAGGARLTTCQNDFDNFVDLPLVPDATPAAFDDACISDDILNLSGTFEFSLDSRLRFLVPGTPAAALTFFVHVLDFRGDARPDLAYQIKISGAN